MAVFHPPCICTNIVHDCSDCSRLVPPPSHSHTYLVVPPSHSYTALTWSYLSPTLISNWSYLSLTPILIPTWPSLSHILNSTWCAFLTFSYLHGTNFLLSPSFLVPPFFRFPTFMAPLSQPQFFTLSSPLITSIITLPPSECPNPSSPHVYIYCNPRHPFPL